MKKMNANYSFVASVHEIVFKKRQNEQKKL